MNTEREDILLAAFEDILPYAIRYAHGRHTAAPYNVRDAVKAVKGLRPDMRLHRDVVIMESRRPDPDSALDLNTDYLFDLFEGEE